MPGICGILYKHPGHPDSRNVLAMTQSMAHRPDAVVGSSEEPRLNVSIGWVAHEGSAGAKTPLWNTRRDVCLILTGEIASAEGRELAPTSSADNEHPLLKLYERGGASMVKQLNGWFSGLILDIPARKVFLFNDRYGLSRIYLHETNDALYFASEAKALLRVLPQLRALDPRGLAEWLSCGCVLENRTLFPQITLLPPASLWTFQSDTGITQNQYFHPREWEEQDPLEPEAYYQGLKDRFETILPRYFNGEQPCGISLTGGVDSRLIMAWRPPTAQGIRCYSFGGPIRDCADVTLGRRVAKALASPHDVLRITPDFFQAFPDLAAKAAYISDGSMDATGAVELFVNAAAREIAPIRITGNYGGEILRRTVAFGPRALSHLPFAPEVNTAFETAAATYRSNRGGHPLSFIAFKQVPWHHYSRLSIEQSQLTVRSPFLDNDLVQHVYRAPGLAATEKGVSLRLINDGHPELRSIPTDRGLRYQRRPLLDALSQKWIGLTVKAEYACDYGMPQWAVPINRALEALRPDRLFLGRHKFYHFRSWYRRELGNYVGSTLLASRTLQRSHFDPQGLRMLVERHVSGQANYTTEINRVLALEVMQQQLLDISYSKNERGT